MLGYKNVRFQRLGDSTNLVNLQQQRITRILVFSSFNAFDICRQQVIPDQFNRTILFECIPGWPVVFRKWVFQEDDWILVH